MNGNGIPAAAGEGRSAMSLHVLAVDDSSTVRAILAKALRVAGIDVARFAEASRGDEALRMMREERFDLVFCDLNMPGMTGTELIRALRADDALATVAVVVVSSVGNPGLLRELKEQGVRGYLRKPLRPEQLRQVVHGVVGGTHELRA
jgi:two-component system chemotaxis response regulator CheY